MVVLAIWSMWPPTPAPSAASSSAAARTGERQSNGPAATVAPVKLEALTAERQPPGETPRNPFRYQPKAPPPPPPRVAAPPAAADVEPAKPVAPAGPPPTPPIPLKFIGVLTRANGVQWAVLSDGKAPMHGREGDIIDGRYRIVKIGTESIELTYVDGRGRQVVRLTGQ